MICILLILLSYSINVIEYTDDEQLTLSKKRKVSDITYLWHLRLGNINPNRIHGLVKSGDRPPS